MRFQLVLSLASLLALTACSAKGTPTTPTTTTNHGTMSATIDGAPWNAVVISTAAIQAGVLRLAGQDSMTTPFVALGVSVPPTVGTYSVSGATGATVAGSLDQTSATAPTLLQWNANFTFGSGTITLATVTATTATGTFSFNLVHIATESIGTRVITNGVFNITF